MNLIIYSLKKINIYKKIITLNIYFKNESFSIMKRYYPLICFIKKIIYYNNKINILKFKKGFLVCNNNKIKIFCEKILI